MIKEQSLFLLFLSFFFRNNNYPNSTTRSCFQIVSLSIGNFSHDSNPRRDGWDKASLHKGASSRGNLSRRDDDDDDGEKRRRKRIETRECTKDPAISWIAPRLPQSSRINSQIDFAPGHRFLGFLRSKDSRTEDSSIHGIFSRLPNEKWTDRNAIYDGW